MGDETASLEAAQADSPDAPSGWGGANRRAWGRAIGGTTSIAQNGTISADARVSMGGFQTGVDLFATDKWNAGLYVSHLLTDTRVNGTFGLNAGGYAGSMHADSYYLGGYATYANKQGQYADFVLQYGLHDASGTTQSGGTVSAGGKSLTLSAEGGQRFSMGGNWGIESQAQLIYNQQSLDNATISGATVQQSAASAVVGRLGVRVTGDIATNAGRLQPYGRVNLWHGFSATDRTNFIGPAGSTTIASKTGYTSTELAVGFTLALTPTASVYGEVGKLFHAGGSQSQVKSSAQASLGLKLKF
jgi:outer membrane autotransporter protein